MKKTLLTVAFLFLFSVQAYAEDYDAIIRNANIYIQTNEYSKAFECYETAKQLKPDSEEPYILEAKLYICMSDYGNAFVSIGKALNLAPFSKEALLLRDELDNDLNNYKKNDVLIQSDTNLFQNRGAPLTNASYSGPDSEKPIIDLDSVECSAETATVGDEILISLRITDNVGVSRAVISIHNQESNKTYHYESLSYNDITDRWEYLFNVTESTPNGKWVISDIQAYDSTNNVNEVFPYIELVTVYGGADSEKPEIDIESISSDTDLATVGGTILISLRITDNVGVSRAVISIHNQESNKTYDYEPLSYNDITDRWEYLFNITESTPNGKWVISNIQAYDAIGNVNVLSPYILIVTVYGAADSEKPDIDIGSISSSVENATIGDKVTISLRINDDTGVNRAVVSIHNQNSNNTLHYMPLSYNNVTDRWEYVFSVEPDTPDGLWSISHIQAYDEVGNVEVVSPFTPVFQTNHVFDFLRCADLILPSSIKEIYDEAFFNGCFSSVLIPYGCEKIGSKSFISSQNTILRVFIPASVDCIATDAFGEHDNVVIYSESNCYAREYADEHNFIFVINK